MKYLPILFVICMWGCKEKKESGMLTVDNSGDLYYTADSHTFDGRLPIGAKGNITPIATGTPAWMDTIPKKDTAVNWSKFREYMGKIGELQYETDLSTISRLNKKGKLSPYETVELLRAHCGASNWYSYKKIDSLENEIKKLKSKQ